MSKPASASERYPFLALVLGMVILLPMLTFPLHTDHATFLRGGLSIIQGGTLYVDFIDVKPPMMYVLYALPAAISGTADVGVRFFDWTWQGAALAVLIGALLRSGYGRTVITFIVASYAVMYVSVHANNTAHAEGLMSLPLAILVNLLTRTQQRWHHHVLAGLSLALIILLKYTLGIVAPALALAYIVTAERKRDAVRLSLYWVVWTLVAFAVMIAPLVRPGFLDGWREVTAYLQVYASYPPLSASLIREWLKTIGTLAGDTLSIAVILAAALGSARVLQQRTGLSNTPVAIWMLVVTLALLISVVIERRFSIYHVERMYLPLSVLVGLGLSMMFSWVARIWSTHDALRRTILATCIVVLAVLSPLPRYANIVILAARSLGNPDAYTSYFSARVPAAVDHFAMRDVAAYVNSRTTAQQHTMLMSITAASIAPVLTTNTPSVFGDSHLYFGVGARPSWKTEAAAELARTDWLIVDDADRHPVVNLHNRSSFESLQGDQVLWPIVLRRFVVDTVIGPYHVYRNRVLP